MNEFQQISTSSTINDSLHQNTKSPLESQEKEEEIPEWQNVQVNALKI